MQVISLFYATSELSLGIGNVIQPDRQIDFNKISKRDQKDQHLVDSNPI